jgi:N-glycosylase/DNA lyase
MFVKDIQNFDLKQTFECGQCFRWNKCMDGSYLGIAGDYVIKASYKDGGIQIECDDDGFAADYFDLTRDYGKIINAIKGDGIIKKAAAAGKGIRLLKQPPWETLVSFIISANNNIPRIKKIIELLCRNFGEPISYNGCIYYKFPSAKALSGVGLGELSSVRCGFRDKYILDAALKVVSGEVDLESVYKMSCEEGRHYLKKIKGVGDKVADCVLLYAYQKYDVFPKDVWIKRILKNRYNVPESNIDAFVRSKFGEYGGFAQQYLYYYFRDAAG